MEILLLRPRQYILIFSILLLNIKEFQCRKINFTVNPHCVSDCTNASGCDPQNCELPWLIYGIGDNGKDYIHYLWGFMELPTFLMISSTNDSEISIDWTALTSGKPNSVLFDPPAQSVFGVSFQSLILFNDVNDTGTLDNIPEISRKVLSMADFSWSLENVKKNTTDDWSFVFKSSMFQEQLLSDSDGLFFQVTSKGKSGRSELLPHLITTSENSQVGLLLKNLINVVNDSLISNANYLRFGVDAIILSSDVGKSFTYSSKKSLDDEFTPGVFQLNSIASKLALVSSNESYNGGYMQWKPVCYLTTERDVNFATIPNLNTSLPPMDQIHLDNSNKSLVYALFGEKTKMLLGAQTTIAFGEPNDGFYEKYNYTEWTFSMGLGILPEEKFSNVVIIVMCVGVGLPVVLVLLGGIYLCVKKVRRSSEVPLLGED